MQKGPSDIQAVFRIPVQQPGRKTIAGYADRRQSHNQPSNHRLRILKSLDGLENNKGGRTHQYHHIDLGRQNFSPAITERVLHRCSLAADTKSDIGYQYGGKVAEIVNGVRNQGHAVGQNPADDLGDRDNKIQTQGHQKTGSAGIFHVHMVMRMTV